MIVGLDGGALSVTDDRLKVGVYKVTKRFLENISHNQYSNYYRIYTFKKVGESEPFFQNPQIEERLVRPSLGWQKVWLPLELLRHPVNVFLGFSQMLPNFTSYNIGFIYDLGFLHYPEFYPNSAQSLTKLTSNVIKRADHLITISNYVKSDILQHFQIESKKISVCYLGVDNIYNDSDTKFRNNKPYFLYVGALKPGKNIPIMIQAFAQFIAKSKIDYDLYLIGSDYWKDPKIDRTIHKLHLETKVHQLGYVSDIQLAEYYRGAKAFISLSLTDGFDLPVVEAMASRIPVIVSDKTSHTEIVKECGYLVNPEDIHKIVDTLLLIHKEKTSPQLIYAAQKRAQQFTWKRFTDNVLDIIQQKDE